MSQLQTKWIADGAITGAKLAASAKQSVLESKLFGVRRGVLTFSASASSSDVVTTEVGAAAADVTPRTDLTTGEGIFTGTVSSATDPKKVLIRQAGTDNGVSDGAGDEIYGKLSEAGGVFTLSYFKGSDNTAFTFGGATNIDFYFVEVQDIHSMHEESYLMSSVSGVIDAGQAATISGHLNGGPNKHDASEIDVETAGTYTTVSDLETNLGALDTALAAKAESSVVTEIDQNVDDLITLSGVGENSADLGSFTGTTIADSSTIKSALQSLETAVETFSSQTDTCDSFTLSGTDITNRYVDLTSVPDSATCVQLFVIGAPMQEYGVDFAIISDGTDNKRLTWDSADPGVSSGLESILEASDVLKVYYQVA